MSVSGVRVGKSREPVYHGEDQSEGGNTVEFVHHRIEYTVESEICLANPVLPQSDRKDNGWRAGLYLEAHPINLQPFSMFAIAHAKRIGHQAICCVAPSPLRVLFGPATFVSVTSQTLTKIQGRGARFGPPRLFRCLLTNGIRVNDIGHVLTCRSDLMMSILGDCLSCN